MTLHKQLTKDRLARELAAKFVWTRRFANEVIDFFVDSVSSHFAEGGETFLIRGFGTFTCRRRRSSETVHPLDPTVKIRISPRKSITFKNARELAARINL